MIKLVDVNKEFKGRQVLKNINLEINEGETLAIIGSSGSGKSTLLRLMIGLLPPTSGEIWINDNEISKLPERRLDQIRLTMGMVFQYSALFDSMTVGDNVAFGLREHTKLSETEIGQIVDEKLKLVDLAGFEKMMPNELSGGMKKRVSLARAVAFGPEIILYDEPSSGLDPIMAAKIDSLIVHTQEIMNVTSVVVTHDMRSAFYIADRIAMIYEGEIIAIDTVNNIKKSTDLRVQEFLRGGNRGRGETEK
jgi:phospholipid/cholesterol/gamma-HCH transport system ATP-binding protein